MKQRDDLQLFEYKYNGTVYCYRIMDNYIEYYPSKDRYLFTIPVYKKEENEYIGNIQFSLDGDELYNAHSCVEEKIRKYADKNR